MGGSVGYMSGFMMQRGTMIVCGDAGDGIGDSMYEGTVYVGGTIHALGADCVEAELTGDDRALLESELGANDIDCGRLRLEEARLRPQAVELLEARVRRLEGSAVSEFIPRGEDGHVHQKLWVWSPGDDRGHPDQGRAGPLHQPRPRHHPPHRRTSRT